MLTTRADAARHASSVEEDDRRAASRERAILLIDARPSPWPIRCDGCQMRDRSGVAALGLGADVHLCRECLAYARDVVDQALREMDLVCSAMGVAG